MNATLRLPPGYTLHALGEVASTNDEAVRLAETGAPEAQVVWARAQTRGRGRHGRSWASPVGNLYASVLLRPACSMRAAAGLSLVSGLAVVEALQTLGPGLAELKLKWPNDVLLGGAKVAGILLESGGGGREGEADWVVIGSGVNLASAPVDTPYPASSLAAAGFAGLTPALVLEGYLGRLDHWYRVWRAEGFEAVRRAWLVHGFGLGSAIRLRLAREELVGRFVDLTASGTLLLEQGDGRRREVAAGDVLYGH